MSGRDLFGVVVRSLGTILILWGVYTLGYAAAQLSGVQMPTVSLVRTHLIFGTGYLVFGFFVLIGGEVIVWLAYGAKKPN